MANLTQFQLSGADGVQVAAYCSVPDGDVRGAVQIAHGMAEHFLRYTRLTERLNAAGYAVYGQDHRGHGASVHAHGLGDFGARGFQSVVDDMAALSTLAKLEQAGKPFALLGHSMGSFASQLYLLQHSRMLDALILSGTAAQDLMIEAMLASGGPVGLEALNGPFEPARTPFDWLSRHEAEVDAYVADPLCGFALTEASMNSLFALGVKARHDRRLANVSKALPVLVISGEHDPVTGPDNHYAKALVETYQALGLSDVTHKIYPGARHELFNETCRDDVETDLVDWLDRVLV
jgi:alpha-beta hydrolase superfamily lysophospholipase